MATSSITANFSIRDPQEASAFVDALLSKSRPQIPPARKRNWTFANSVKEIERKRTKVGGKVVFLEYEKNRPKLRGFYQSCAFEEFKMPSDADDASALGQMFCFLND